MKGLITLPYEVLANIASNVDFDDIISLGRSCKSFQYLHTEESICKSIVQAKIAFSKEARLSTIARCGNASALRRAAKRREAFASASPFVVATVALGDAFLYCKGVLCYTLDDRIRVLDLHNSGQHEIVISIPGLLTCALPDIEDNSRGLFQILYYSDNILSCVYKPSSRDATAWLVAFNKNTRQILVAEDLASTDKIFVRHNRQYLYYGTHSEVGTDGYKKWVIHGFDFRSRKWFPEKIHLPDMVGSEISSTICFEFYQDYFYALSNQTSFEVEEIDWTSFYHCIRFPLSSPCMELLQKTENQSMWRRQHQEGPIDDRWTSLRLDEDETSGELKIVESRKEWHLGSSRSQITYYKTDIVFPIKDEVLGFLHSLTAPTAHNPTFPSTSSFSSASISSATTVFSSSTSASSSSTSISLPTAAPPTLSNTNIKQDLSSLPDDPLLRLLRPDDNPHHMRPPPRLPQHTHPGNDGSHEPTFTLAKSRIRHYHTSASTYLDLIDDPNPTDWKGTQRLRLRAGSRKLGPLLTQQSGIDRGLLREPSSDLQTALKEMYREQPIVYWPPAQDPDHPDEDLDAVYRLLNPPSHLGNVQGSADERSLVYATGGCDKPQAIVFVGFDPAMRLVGLKRWGGIGAGFRRKGVGEGPHIDGRAAGYGDNNQWPVGKANHYVDVGEANRRITMDRKGKGKAQPIPVVQVCSEAVVKVEVAKEEVFGTKGRSWAWSEKAMYRDIANGFYFGLPKKRG